MLSASLNKTFSPPPPTNDPVFMNLEVVHVEINTGINKVLIGRKEGNVLFNDTRNTFYLRLYGIGHMVKDHSDSERGNRPHGLLFLINSKGSFICPIPQTG